MTTTPQPSASTSPWRSAQSRAQYRAIAWLRWRIFLNQFRRKGSVGDLVANIIAIPILSSIALGISFGIGFWAWYLAGNGQLDHVSWILWAAFFLCQFLNINFGQPGTTFDPTQLIRFPMASRNYVAIKLFFGLLTPANIIVSLLSFAVALGITISLPHLWLYTFFALAIFAATNVLFTRMIFAWVDRWLSTRRAREIFTLFIFVGSLGIQWINVNFNPAYNGHHHHGAGTNQQRIDFVTGLYQRLHPALTLLPPEVTSLSLVAAQHGRLGSYLTLVFYCACFAALFLAIFAIRTRTEFRGEVFSDAANGVANSTRRNLAPAHLSAATLPSAASQAPSQPNSFGFTPGLAGLFGKEFLTMRRNTGVFYSLIAPVFMVLLFAGKLATHNTSAYILPCALAYALMGIVPVGYNSFGLEGAGVQLYFFAPIRARDIFVAKNLMLLLMGTVEVAAVFVIICGVATLPPFQITISALFWAVMTLLVSLTVGNRRSITAPKKIDLGRTTSKQASPLSALLSIGILLLCAGLGVGLYRIATLFNILWSLPLLMSILAALALVIYLRDLRALDAFMNSHREELFAELCKK